MTKLVLTRRVTFRSPTGSEREYDSYEGPGVFDVPEDEVEQFLFRDMWVRPEDVDAAMSVGNSNEQQV